MTEVSAAIEDLTGEYTFDPQHTRIGFVARHAMVTKVRGSFQQFEGKLSIDAQNPSRSSVELKIDVASLTTGQDQRDAHLRSADFFDIENYPQMLFRSTEITGGGDKFECTGDLTIRDVTRPVTVGLEYTGSAKDPFGNYRIGFEGSGDVNRKDWGIEWNAALETGGFLVSDKIKLELDVSAIKNS